MSSSDESGSCVTEVASSPLNNAECSPNSMSPSPMKRPKRSYAPRLRRRLYSPSGSENQSVGRDPQEISIPASPREDEGSSAADSDVDDTDSSDSCVDNSSESSDEDVDLNIEQGDGSLVADVEGDGGLLEVGEGTVENDESGNDCLFDGSPKSTNQAILDILKVFIKERWSKTSLDANVKLIKQLLPQPNDLPNSGRAMLKHVEKLTSLSCETEYLYCPQCKILLDSAEDTCICWSKMATFFAFSIEDQIRHLFENRNLALLIDTYRDTLSKEHHVCDIRDGSVYNDIKVHLKGLYDIVLLWNTDGISLSKSSKQQLWVVLSTICEIPPKLRSKFVIVSGIYVGTSKPDMNIFLQPFVNSLQDIFKKGGITWTHQAEKKTFTSMVVAPALSADAPATAISLNVLQYNAKYGCNVCELKAQRVKIYVAQGERVKHKRCFVFQEDCAVLRSGSRMERQGKLAERRGKPLKGVIGQAVISNIPLADRALCVTAEYLHTVLLGVVRYVLSLLFFEEGGPWYIGDKKEDIQSFMLNEIKVPDYMKRLHRAIIDDFKLLKGNELRSFLLFFSLPIFRKIMSAPYLQHWLLLVSAICILLKEEISPPDLEIAEILLRCFVRDFGVLYGDKFYTYNVHNLLHLCLLVKRWGPLWATSAFAFETFNGFMSSHVHGTKHLGRELLNNLKIIQSVSVLETMINPYLPVQAGVQPVIELLGKCVDSKLVSYSELQSLSHFNNYSLYTRAKVKGEFFTSKRYDDGKERAMSFVKFCTTDGSFYYGQIYYFIKKHDETVHLLVKVYSIKHADLFIHEDRFSLSHILPVEESTQFSVISCNHLVMKVIKVCDFFCIPPNSVEINL